MPFAEDLAIPGRVGGRKIRVVDQGRQIDPEVEQEVAFAVLIAEKGRSKLDIRDGGDEKPLVLVFDASALPLTAWSVDGGGGVMVGLGT